MTPPTADAFAGKVIVITGAGSGIGLAAARLLATGGAIVHCWDVTGSAAAVEAIRGDGGEAFGADLDVRDKRSVEELFAGVKAQHGRLDGLVTSAGVMADGPIEALSEEALDRVLAINLKGTLWCCQAAAAIMRTQRSGSIVTLSSAAADRNAPGTGAYAMSKGAVIQLTRVLALELAEFGVRVNAVSPGFIATRITERHYTLPDGTIDEARRDLVLARFADTSPMKRVGASEECAAAIAYLLGDGSSYVTGQILRVNGGLFMG